MRRNKTAAEFEAMIEGAEILEREISGIKVLQLPDQRILKLFRRKRLISSQIWAPHAWRFSRNARILKERGIPTITVESHFEIPEIERQAVVYYRLEGQTLREWMAAHDVMEQRRMIARLATFIAQIHEAGVLFRSLHFGNILVIENSELALIDIVDMGFRWYGPLTLRQRIRNFHHIDRYDADRMALASEDEGSFISHYLQASTLSETNQRHIFKSFHDIFAKYRSSIDV